MTLRNSKTPDSKQDIEKLVDSSRSKCLPRAIKMTSNKQPKNEAHRSSISDGPRKSSVGQDCKELPIGEYQKITLSVNASSTSVESFKERKEKVIKIEESYVVSHCPCHLLLWPCAASSLDRLYLSPADLCQGLVLQFSLELHAMIVRVVLILEWISAMNHPVYYRQPVERWAWRRLLSYVHFHSGYSIQYLQEIPFLSSQPCFICNCFYCAMMEVVFHPLFLCLWDKYFSLMNLVTSIFI